MMTAQKPKPFAQGREDYQAGYKFEHAWKRVTRDEDISEWKRGWIFERNTERARQS